MRVQLSVTPMIYVWIIPYLLNEHLRDCIRFVIITLQSCLFRYISEDGIAMGQLNITIDQIRNLNVKHKIEQIQIWNFVLGQ